MVSRSGILSNKMMEENCVDYNVLPLGYINSQYSGSLSNPYLQGIKTPKYQMAAPKPASGDVAATSLARLMGGNRQKNARLILDNFQKEAREWVAPKVSIEAQNRAIKDRARPQVASILPRSSPGQTLGSSILKQTIGLNSEDLARVQQRYIAHYATLSAERQREVGGNLVEQLEKDSIVLRNYEVSAQVLRGKGTSSSPAKQSDRVENIKRAISVFHLRNSSVDLDGIFGLLPQHLTSKKEEPSGPPVSAGAETMASDASTQQGIAQPATTSTQPEIEKK